MATKKATKAKNKDSEGNTLTPENQLKSYLESNKESHFNFEDDPYYKVSSGSLLFDVETGGGISPGIIRISGASSGGKTSMTLKYMQNFLNDDPSNRRGLFIKAEGRLGKEIKERSGINFVEDPDKWTDGTCFVFKTNVYEVAINLLRELVKNNPKKTKYFIVIDSIDNLTPQNDYEKDFDEEARTAGQAKLTTEFLKRLSLAMTSCGHICALISQVRSNIQINPYSKGDPKLTNASGANILTHNSDWVFEVQQRYKNDLITSKPQQKGDILGHYCRVFFRKTPKEKEFMEIRYPIKHNQKDGKSVWVEQELVDLLLMWQLATQSSAWIYFEETTINELKEQGIQLNKAHQGVGGLRTYLEENPEITNYFFKKFTDIFSNES